MSLTVTITRVRYRQDDVHDGSIPTSAYDAAITETINCHSWADAVRAMTAEGLTEWSSYPAQWNDGHGWFANPDGAVDVWGGDMYDPGYDREEVTGRLSGTGAYRAWVELTHGTADANMYRRSPHPVLGGAIADGWDGGDPWGSGMSALGAVCDVLYALDPNAIPGAWGFRPAMGASGDIDEIIDSGEDYGFETSDLAECVRDGTVTEADLVSAGNILNRYLDCVPEDRRY